VTVRLNVYADLPGGERNIVFTRTAHRDSKRERDLALADAYLQTSIPVEALTVGVETDDEAAARENRPPLPERTDGV
jgi:hypothetical protein